MTASLLMVRRAERDTAYLVDMYNNSRSRWSAQYLQRHAHPEINWAFSGDDLALIKAGEDRWTD